MTVDHQTEKVRLQRLTDTELADHLSDAEFLAALAAEELRRRQRLAAGEK